MSVTSTAAAGTAPVATTEIQKSDWTIWPLSQSPVLTQFGNDLHEVITAAGGHDEMYGVKLLPGVEGAATPPPVSTLIILQKFLRANENDLVGAKEQLTAALKSRGEYNPLQARDEVFDGDKFASLGFVTRLRGATETGNAEDVVTFNIYGAAAKEAKKVFGDTEGFVRWRVALMELTLAELKLNEATEPIPNYGEGPDPYTAINVHDYLSVSFFRQPAEIKASSSKIIDMFQRYYPETASYKYFVNVPIVMQWMMGAMKALMSKDSIQKMTWMTYGTELHKYLGPEVSKNYGGNGPALAEVSKTPRYKDVAGAAEAKEESADALAAAPAVAGEEAVQAST